MFEEDVVTGRTTEKVPGFPGPRFSSESPDNVHVNISGYPKNRLLHRITTRVLGDELIVRKIKDVFKMTPFYAASRRIYRKILEANLKKEELAPKTRQMLKEKFQDDVALLAEYTGLPLQKFWRFPIKLPLLLSLEVIVVPNNLIFAKIFTYLHLNEFQGCISPIFQPVFDSQWDIGRFIDFPDQKLHLPG